MNLGLEGIVITCEVKAVVPKMSTIEDKLLGFRA